MSKRPASLRRAQPPGTTLRRAPPPGASAPRSGLVHPPPTTHTGLVRAALLLALAGLAGHAASATAGPDPDARDHGDFWAEVVSPNHDELLGIKAQLRDALSIAAGDWNPEHRAALLREATRLARHARTLDPADAELVFYLGAIADDAGRAVEAQRLLTQFTSGASRGPLRGEALLRLGKLALRQGSPAHAIAPLRQAVAERADRRVTTIAAVHLADALDGAGRTSAAIDLLSQRVAAATGNWDNEEALLVLALAVLYDRDEQISQAFDLVTRAQRALDGAYAERFEAGLQLAPPAPAVELHYHRAFLYETAGFVHEARAEWAAYVRLAGASPASGRSVARARAHLAALDEQLRARRPAKGKRP